jgi:hypothetical protein
VIDRALDVLKWMDGPGSIPWLVVGLALGLVLVARAHTRAWGRWWLAMLAITYIVLATPVVANGIAASLRVAQDTRDYGQVDALVVFDGDNRRGRAAVAKTIFFQSHPSELWVIGIDPEWIHEQLRMIGVPWKEIRIDRQPGTTRAQVDWIARYLARQRERHVVVVVSRLQQARVHAMFDAMGLPEVTVIGAPLSVEPASTGLRRFLPTYDALRVSRDACYEHAALVYYQLRGWIAR